MTPDTNLPPAMPPVDVPEEPAQTFLPEYVPPPAPPRGIRPEIIMAVIALFAGVGLLVMFLLCRPFMGREEDPQLLLERQHLTQQAQAMETLPTTLPTEPTLTEETTPPTIPPDPNPYGRLDFQYQRHNYLYCLRTESYAGVDVSSYQGDIDWKQVAASGIDFAMVRLGYRGYGKAGRLVEDEWAQKNLFEASREGLSVGAYFFSQALTFQEVEDEINFLLEILGDRTLDMPIVLDWEIPTPEARTANMDPQTLTELQLYFCEKMSALGYQPMVYFNWHQSENLYYLSELEDYPFWLALYQDRMTFPWKVEMWQFTCTGQVPGIQGEVDVNVYMPE